MQKIRKGVDYYLSEFKIKITTEADKRKAEEQLKQLRTNQEQKKLKLNIEIGNLSKINNQISQLKGILNKAFKFDNTSLSNLKQMENALKEINKLSQTAQKNMFGNSNSTQLDSNVNQYKQLVNEINAVQKQLTKTSSSSGKLALNNQLDILKTKLNDVKGKLTDVQKQSLQAFDDKAARNLERSFVTTFDKIQSSISKTQSSIKSMSSSGYVDKGALSSLESTLNKIKAIDLKNLNAGQLSSVVSAIENVNKKLKETQTTADRLKFNDKLKLDTSKVQSDLDKLRQKCMEAGTSTVHIDRLERELRELSTLPMDKVPTALSKIKNEVSGMKSSFNGLNSVTKQTNTFFNDLYRTFSTFTLGNMIGVQIQKGVRSIGQVIISLDDAMRDMMKVAPADFKGTTSELQSVKLQAIDIAKSVGQSSEDVIRGTAKALQTGIKNMDEAMKYAKSVSMFANVGDMQQDDADKYIAGIMSAFGGVNKALKPVKENIQGMGKDYNQLTKFIDLANYAGNNFAISTKDVGEALSRSASSLSSFGVSMEDSVALVMGMNESLQNSEKTGTALKTISTNFTAVKAAAKFLAC